MGTPLNRSPLKFQSFTNTHLPLYNSRYFDPGCGGVAALAQFFNRLGRAQQFRQSPVQLNTQNSRDHSGTTSGRHSPSTMVARAAMVSDPATVVHPTASTDTKPSTHVPANRLHFRTFTHPRMEALCLADLWKEKVTYLGWDSRPSTQLSLHWATVHLVALKLKSK